MMNVDELFGACYGCWQERRTRRTFTRKVIAFGIVCAMLFADLGEASFLKCVKDSMCSNKNPNYCCVAVNDGLGMCKVKRGVGQRCYPEVKRRVLFGGGTAYSDCGCAPGLTCTQIERKRWKHRRRKRKRRKRYKYRCLPTPTEVPEVHEKYT